MQVLEEPRKWPIAIVGSPSGKRTHPIAARSAQSLGMRRIQALPGCASQGNLIAPLAGRQCRSSPLGIKEPGGRLRSGRSSATASLCREGHGLRGPPAAAAMKARIAGRKGLFQAMSQKFVSCDSRVHLSASFNKRKRNSLALGLRAGRQPSGSALIKSSPEALWRNSVQPLETKPLVSNLYFATRASRGAGRLDWAWQNGSRAWCPVLLRIHVAQRRMWL
jgi:hypothetical protein